MTFEEWWRVNWSVGPVTGRRPLEIAWGAATAAERERCIAECEVLAQKWFAEERRSWGMAAGECAAKLENAIRETNDDV